MKRKITILTLVSACVFGVLENAFTGPNDWDGKTAHSGAPGEETCLHSGCHSGNAMNSSGGSMTITSNMPGWMYTPGQTYQISVTLKRTGQKVFGLDMVALKSDGSNGGTFTITNKLETQILNATVSGKSRANVTHVKDGGKANDTKVFMVDWKAPATNTGAITFYAAGNAANASGTVSGDYIYTTKVVANPSTTGVSSVNNSGNALIVFPNPSSGKINVTYNVEMEGLVKIELYDIQGKLKQLLMSENKAQGVYTYTFNTDANLIPGFYFVKAQMGEDAQLTKILIQ
jgi:hypothetical protein